jgi:hypothetical protein
MRIFLIQWTIFTMLFQYNSVLTNNFDDGITLVFSKLVHDGATIPASVTRADVGHDQLVVTIGGLLVDDLDTVVVGGDEKTVLEAANRALKSLTHWLQLEYLQFDDRGGVSRDLDQEPKVGLFHNLSVPESDADLSALLGSTLLFLLRSH